MSSKARWELYLWVIRQLPVWISWEYARHFPDRQRAFASITRRVPFYMGLTLLRIARNSWVNGHYRRNLVEEAKKTLR